MRKRVAHELTFEINWNGSDDWKTLESDIVAQRGIVDRVIITKDSITYFFERASSLDAAMALENQVRKRQLVNVLQLISLSTDGHAPKLEGAKLATDRKTANVPISQDLRAVFDEWERVWCVNLLPQCVAKALLSTGPIARALRTAGFFLLSSREPGRNEFDRFRDLWSSFNGLYSCLFEIESLSSKKNVASQKGRGSEDAKLACCAKALVSETPRTVISQKTYQVYHSEVSPMLDALSWGYHAPRSLLSRSQKPKQDVINSVLSKAVKERLLEKLDAQNSRDKNSSKSGYNDLAEKLRHTTAPDSDNRTIAFLCTRYLYDVRCDTMHGKRANQLFSFTRSPSMRPLNDLLESCVIDCMVHIAKESNSGAFEQ